MKCSTCKGTVEKNVCKSLKEYISEGNGKIEKDAETAMIKQSRKEKNKNQSALTRSDNDSRELKTIKG